jgi:predicted nucleic acid-binding protein
VLIDTDVLIWFHRGNEKALRLLDQEPEINIATQTALEFMQAAPSKARQEALRSFMSAAGISILPLSEAIGHRALVYIEQYSLAHGLRAGDALIAATAVESGQPLLTANDKHFRFIPSLKLKAFRP